MYIKRIENDKHKVLILHEIIFDEYGKPLSKIYLDVSMDWIKKLKKMKFSDEPNHYRKYTKPIDNYNSMQFFNPYKNQSVTVITASEQVTQIRQTLMKQYELLKTTMMSLSDGVIAVDLEDKVTMMNIVAEKMTGWSQKEGIGKSFDSVFVLKCHSMTCKGDEESFTEAVVDTDADVDILVSQYLSKEKFLVDRCKNLHAIEECIAPIEDISGNIFGKVVVFRDITDKNDYFKHIEYLSYHDQLTGLYNRRFFDEELKRIDTERNLPLSLVMLDVNGLKLTNDAFGHHKGDRLLKKVAQILKFEFRTDDIVARIGGDEFAVLLPKTSREELMPILERIKYAAEHSEFENIILSFSAGSDTKTKQYENIIEVFIRAENEMYRNKLVESKTIRNRTIQLILKTLSEKYIKNNIHHSQVTHWCMMIGHALNLSREELNELDIAALIYDIGKISISDDILSKPDKLTENEYEKIKKHPEVGYQILKSVDQYTNIAEYALSYHERWDGSGYPRKLAGEQIPRFARIIAIADTYEALISERPYRPAMQPCNALKYIESKSDIEFDPNIVNIFVNQLIIEDNPCYQF